MLARFALALAAALVLHAPARAGVVVAVRANAEVTARQYHLGDIAEVSADDPHVAERVRTMVVGMAVRLGSTETVTRSRIAKVLEANAPELRGQLEWRGEEAVRINSRAIAIEGADLVEAARATLADFLAQTVPGARIEPVAGPSETLVPAAGTTILKPRLAAGLLLSKRMCVWIDLVNDGALLRSVPVWFAVSIPARVWVARQTLKAGAPLDAAVLREQEGDLAALGGVPLTPAALPFGSRLKKTLVPGSVVTAADIEETPAVAKNQRVQVRSASGAVAVESTAVAVEDGRVGQLVRLVNRADQGEYVGRVVAAGTVVVE